MNGARKYLKKIFTPVTILLVPHTRTRSISIRIPIVGVAASVILFLVGTGFVASLSVQMVEYHRMKARVSYLSAQFVEMQGTMQSLKQA